MSAWRDVPTLSGRHVTLRPMVRADREGILSAFDGLHGQFTTIVPDAASFDGWMAGIESAREAGRALPFTVLDAEGAIAGVTRFMRMNEPHRRLEIGGTIYARRVQRTGLNSEAKKLLLAHAFDVLGANCVQLRTDFLNRESRRAIERLGARFDGVLRGHMILNGHHRDSVVYSILAHEWAGVRRNLDLLMARYDGEAA
ncbi:GNAT family protein [Sphingomonas sp. HITSZ_GF]|uniref:GNAT family N-acetyltransferase n=1 Tax=Sphingomonas sp. HITSZ_GF TaxID=3037247 RepID=UPI00240D81A8|nr:GNAT family protein [Sphingomonas sp. HITSZ_GF]MDG2532624.1 GNAT family protein [Sphingomonas sp. HITSZ_GF]